MGSVRASLDYDGKMHKPVKNFRSRQGYVR